MDSNQVAANILNALPDLIKTLGPALIAAAAA
jgi:hypothetical protein